MTNVAKVRSAIHAALERIGHRNSHACPADGTNADSYLHELYTAHEGLSHFDKRRKVAIKTCVDIVGEAEVDAVAPGTEQSILEGDHYSLVIKKNNPAERIDKTKIGTVLRKRGWDEAEVLGFIQEVSATTKAATSVRAVPKG